MMEAIVSDSNCYLLEFGCHIFQADNNFSRRQLHRNWKLGMFFFFNHSPLSCKMSAVFTYIGINIFKLFKTLIAASID